MTQRPCRRPRRLRTLLASCLLLAATACSSDGGGRSEGAASAPAGGAADQEPAPAAVEANADPGAGGEAVSGGGGGAEGGGGTGVDAADPGGSGAQSGEARPLAAAVGAAFPGRSVIHVAHLDLEVDDVRASGRQAQEVLAGVGGLLFGLDTTMQPSPRTSLTFKLPPGRLAEALDALQGLGRLQDQRTTADDVTETVVDLRSRILTAEVSVARLRDLLQQAEGVEQIAALEAQLLARETDLERFRGQLRTLEDQVDLATIHLTLVEPTEQPALEAEVSAHPGRDGADAPRCPGDSEVTIDEGDDLVVCVSVLNTGNTPLARVEVRDPGLGLRVEDFQPVDGHRDEVLAPGGQRLFRARVAADPSRSVAVRVTAVPVTAGHDAARSVTAEAGGLSLTVEPDDSLPGFVDAVGAGWGALLRVVGLVVVAVGATLPFLWVVPAALAVLRWRDRRRSTPAAPPPPEATTAGAR